MKCFNDCDPANMASYDSQVLKIHAQKMALELCHDESGSQSLSCLLDLATSSDLADIPIDLRLVVLQVACLPQVVK